MGKKHKKHKPEWRTVDDCEDKPFEKPLKLVLKVGGSEITELSGSGHDSSYYDDRSDHERERHKDKKKKKKKKKKRERDLNESEAATASASGVGLPSVVPSHTGVAVQPFMLPKIPNIGISFEQQEEKKRKRFEMEPEPEMMDQFHPNIKTEDAHGFFTFPVTDAIAPGYSVIIKHPMDFSTMNDKITDNEYKTVTEFKADFKLMCDNAMVYNRPETVYYKAAKKLLHTGFKMMSKERLLALKRSMSFMQDMDFSQQAAILGDEDVASEEPPPEVVPVPVESASAKKSKKQPKDIKDLKEVIRLEECLQPADSTAGRSHVWPEEETHPVDLSSLSNKLLPGLTTLGFKDDRRHKVTFLSSTYNTQTLQNNSIYPDLLPDEMDMLYSAYGDETGVQCALSIQEFVKGCGNVADGTGLGEGSSVLDFMSMKSYSDMSLEMSMLNSLGKSVKKEPEHEDGVSQQHFEEAAKLLQEFQEGQVERGGSRPSSNLSSLSGTSDRDQHHLGKDLRTTLSGAHPLTWLYQSESQMAPYSLYSAQK
ncbi:unnamed protein product [Coregonus sp. 'balchen']|nr:unnamed protein product [Coregonus sp. 'balchen']